MEAGTDDAIQSLLEPDERVLWQGKPDRGAYVWQQYPLFIFGLFWFGFAIFWNVGVWRSVPLHGNGGGGYVFRLFGLPFLVIGLYITFGQLVHRAWEWPRVNYVLTNRRMLVTSGLFSRRQSSLYLDTISSVDLQESFLDRRRGTSSLAVASPNVTYSSSGPGRRGYAYPRVSGFLAARDGGEVLRLTQQARAEAREEKGKGQ